MTTKDSGEFQPFTERGWRYEAERLGLLVWVVWLVAPGGRFEQRTFFTGSGARRWMRRKGGDRG